MKLLGIAFLLSGSVGVGLSAIRRLERRVTALRSLVDALQVMKCEMEFQAPTMEELLFAAAQRAAEPASRFLNRCAQELERGDQRRFFELWENCASDELPELAFDDREILLSLGGILGRYDTEGQKEAIAAARARLFSCLNEAMEARQRKGRVYGALSVSAGMFVLILLI